MIKKFTLLVVFFVLAVMAGIQAQDTRYDTIPGLIISEVRLNTNDYTYIELANADDHDINLKGFKIATSYYYNLLPDWGPTGYAYLPDKVLQPGETFVVAQVADLGDQNYNEGLYLGENHGWMKRTMPEILENVDLPVFWSESSPHDSRDSISGYPLIITTGRPFLALHDGGKNVILEYKKGDDSVFVDLVFATATGDISTFTSIDGYNNEPLASVAGVPRVMGAVYGGGSGQWPGAREYTIIRKTNVTHGNVIWDDSRGTDPDNSEWIVVPGARNDREGMWEWSKYFTTLGRHGNGTIDATTVTSDDITIDWANHKMSVPWGIRRFNLMDHITVGDNITWDFIQNGNSADSAHIYVCTGDKLVMYATGESRQEVDFDMELVAADDQTKALILPLLTPVWSNGNKSWSRTYDITYDLPGMDTIFGMDFGLRVDSLIKYIEIAEGATSKLICVDGQPTRADLKRGDLLRVTNGAVTKDYYLAVSATPILHFDPYLEFIKWPDVPDALRFSTEWKNNDIIPNFVNVVPDYIIDLPSGTTDVPALTAIPEDVNVTVTIVPAKSLNGLPSERTTKITVVAEDGSISRIYTVRFDVTTSASNIQPYAADPIFVRFVPNFGINDGLLAIGNPGTTNIDLSNYVVCCAIGGTSPDQVLARALSAYGFRYFAYVPGYDYATEAEWNANPGIVHPDYQVNPILPPGKCFVMADRVDGWWYNFYLSGGTRSDMMMNPYIDVSFVNINQKNAIEADPEFFMAENMTMIRAGWDWYGAVAKANNKEFQQLYKIVGDSVRDGLKPVGSDLADYQLIDMMGTYDNTLWEPITGKGPGTPVPGEEWFNWSYLPWSIERKPEIYKGNPLPGGSWGTEETSEWTMINEIDIYGNEQVIGFWWAAWQIALGIDRHIFTPVTVNSSTVLSNVYKVSGGYTTHQTINGVITNTTVTDFLANIIKKDPDQTLEVLHKAVDAAVVSDDTLQVTSKDGNNVTRYLLTVSDVGLSDDALLVAKAGSGLTVEVSSNVGTVSGIKFGTTLENLLLNLIKPSNSTLRVIDGSGNLVPMKYTTAENNYMKVNVNDHIRLEVISENSENTITYDLAIAEFTDDAAFLYSNVFDVDQEMNLVSLIPTGIKVQTLFSNLMTNEGATVTLLDKVGGERTAGAVVLDDVIRVTSPDGTVTRIYWLNFVGQSMVKYAYVTSNILDVDQSALTISGIPENTDLSIFLGLVTPAPFAELMVLDAAKSEVTSGKIEEGYELKVTSGDGSKEVTYSLSLSLEPGTEAYVTSNDYLVNQSSKTISLIPKATAMATFLGHITPVSGATVVVLDASGNPLGSGDIVTGYSLKVTSEDLSKVVTYNLLVVEANSEAFVTSDVYWVNPSAMTITQIPQGTALATFMGHITPATGATVVVLDASGNPLASGEIVTGYTLKVTSEDLSTTATYDLTVLTSVTDMKADIFNVYPNPATDKLTIEGLQTDSKVYIINMLGNIVKIVDSNYIQNTTISLEDLAPGIYFIYNRTDEYKSQPVKIIVQ
jgi:hypothetical protein